MYVALSNIVCPRSTTTSTLPPPACVSHLHRRDAKGADGREGGSAKWPAGFGVVVVTGRAERYVDVQTVQDYVDACFQASLAGIDLAKCRKPGVPARGREKEKFADGRERKRKGETERDRAEPNRGQGGKKTVVVGARRRGAKVGIAEIASCWTGRWTIVASSNDGRRAKYIRRGGRREGKGKEEKERERENAKVSALRRNMERSAARRAACKRGPAGPREGSRGRPKRVPRTQPWQPSRPQGGRPPIGPSLAFPPTYPRPRPRDSPRRAAATSSADYHPRGVP